MAVIPIKHSVNVKSIYCKVTCIECDKTFNTHLKGAITRKNCPGCNRVTFAFGIVPMRGAISISVVYTGSDHTPTEYFLDPSDVEIAEEEK